VENKAEKAEEISKEIRYLVIATSSKDGKPWISPVFYAFDDDYNLYWVSSKNSRHSELIRENPKVAVVIFNSTKGEGKGDAVYIEANVQELTDEKEIEEAMKFYDSRASKPELRVKDPQNVVGEKEWRLYKATPKMVFKSSDPVEVNGQRIDTRNQIDLSKLKDLL